MFGSSHVLQWWKGIFPSNASRWCYRAAARSAPIRPESTKRRRRPASSPTESPACRLGRSTVPLSRGNPPKSRIDRLREVWTRAAGGGVWPCLGDPAVRLARGDAARNIFNQLSAGLAFANGLKGFSSARLVVPWLHPAGTIEATSFYDTRDLKRTLAGSACGSTSFRAHGD